MDSAALLRSRAAELRISEEEITTWAPQVDARVVQALLAALVRLEDALMELAR